MSFMENIGNNGKHRGNKRFSFLVDPSGYGYTGDSNLRSSFWKEWDESSHPVFETGERGERRPSGDQEV